MHQYGIGLDQDYHLAKRYYDQAIDLNPSEATVPAWGALLWIHIESFGKRLRANGSLLQFLMTSLD